MPVKGNEFSGGGFFPAPVPVPEVPKLIDQMDLLEQAGLFRLFNKLTSLEMVRFLDSLSAVPLEVRLEDVKPVGTLGLLWKMRTKGCRQGLGVMLELTRALGKVEMASAPAATAGET